MGPILGQTGHKLGTISAAQGPRLLRLRGPGGRAAKRSSGRRDSRRRPLPRLQEAAQGALRRHGVNRSCPRVQQRRRHLRRCPRDTRHDRELLRHGRAHVPAELRRRQDRTGTSSGRRDSRTSTARPSASLSGFAIPMVRNLPPWSQPTRRPQAWRKPSTASR
jgi:hypothetical protein